MVNQAAIQAVLQSTGKITAELLNDARDKITMGKQALHLT